VFASFETFLSQDRSTGKVLRPELNLSLFFSLFRSFLIVILIRLPDNERENCPQKEECRHTNFDMEYLTMAKNLIHH
jgi:hypothetical protein